jgi:spoIIIJ-associated protein
MEKYEFMEALKGLITKMLSSLDVVFSVSYEESLRNGIVFQIVSHRDKSLLIGKNGETLSSFEYLVRQVASKKFGADLPFFSIDVNGYKKEQQRRLKDKVKVWVESMKEKKELELPPMNGADRRLVHMYVEIDYPDVFTESKGVGKGRRVVLKKL